MKISQPSSSFGCSSITMASLSRMFYSEMEKNGSYDRALPGCRWFLEWKTGVYCVLSCVTQSGPKCQESLQWGRLTHSRNLLKRTISHKWLGVLIAISKAIGFSGASFDVPYPRQPSWIIIFINQLCTVGLEPVTLNRSECPYENEINSWPKELGWIPWGSYEYLWLGYHFPRLFLLIQFNQEDLVEAVWTYWGKNTGGSYWDQPPTFSSDLCSWIFRAPGISKTHLRGQGHQGWRLLIVQPAANACLYTSQGGMSEWGWAWVPHTVKGTLGL